MKGLSGQGTYIWRALPHDEFIGRQSLRQAELRLKLVFMAKVFNRHFYSSSAVHELSVTQLRQIRIKCNP